MSFKDEIRQAVAQARHNNLDPENPYLKALSELAEALTTEFIVADVVESSLGGQRRVLRLHARYRPASARPMISFFVENHQVTAWTDERTSFATRESFEQYLKKTVREEAFLISLAELERQYLSPVEAFLRPHDPHHITRDDVLLIVSPDEQRRVAEATEQDELELELDVGGIAGAGIYKKDVVYSYLNSAGLLLHLDSTCRTSEGRIQIKGRRITLKSVKSSPYEQLSDHELSHRTLQLVSGLRSLSSIYRRDKSVLDNAPSDEARLKALSYAATEKALRDYICDQYAASSGVRVREYKRELEKRLQGRMPAEPDIDFFRPDEPSNDIDVIADFLEVAARTLVPPSSS